VDHACNPSYSGDRDQEDRDLKPARANSSRDPIFSKPITKIGLVEWLKVKALSLNPSTKKKKMLGESCYSLLSVYIRYY
jgi:hypothetical protein